jgi:hypothetical protein
MEDKDFIPYQEALELEKLGFDEYCMECCYYEWKDRGVTHILLHTPDSYDSHEGVKAPTYSQAFRWFRDKYDLYCYVEPYKDNQFDYVVVSDLFGQEDCDGELLNTYEEAELACLREMIKIVKENQK